MGFILRGEEVSRGVSDQGVRGGGKPRDVVLQALSCGLSPGAPASLRVGGFGGPLDGPGGDPQSRVLDGLQTLDTGLGCDCRPNWGRVFETRPDQGFEGHK